MRLPSALGTSARKGFGVGACAPGRSLAGRPGRMPERITERRPGSTLAVAVLGTSQLAKAGQPSIGTFMPLGAKRKKTKITNS